MDLRSGGYCPGFKIVNRRRAFRQACTSATGGSVLNPDPEVTEPKQASVLSNTNTSPRRGRCLASYTAATADLNSASGGHHQKPGRIQCGTLPGHSDVFSGWFRTRTNHSNRRCVCGDVCGVSCDDVSRVRDLCRDRDRDRDVCGDVYDHVPLPA